MYKRVCTARRDSISHNQRELIIFRINDWAWIPAHGSGAKHELALWPAGGTNAHTWLSLEEGLMAWLQNKLFYSRPQSILSQFFLVVEKMLTCFSEPTVRTIEDGQRMAALHFLADEHLLPIIQSLTNHIFRTPPGHALRLRQMELFVPLISTRQAYSDRSRRMARCRRARIMSQHSAMTRSSCSARVPLLRVPHTNIFYCSK